MWRLHASLLVLVFFWGLAFVAIKQALEHMSWITLTFLRLGLAAALFLGYLLVFARDRLALPRKDLPMVVLLGFLGFTGYHLFLNLGESDPAITAGTAALIIASAPAFIAVLAVPILRERLGPVRAAGILVAFVGLSVMILFARTGSEYRLTLSQGALAVLPAAVFAAFFSVLGKGMLRKHPPFVLVGHATFWGTLLMVPPVLASANSFAVDVAGMGWEGFAPVLFLGIFPTFVAYGLFFRALARLPAAAAGAYVYLSTLIAVVGGILILGEAITEATVLGGGLVIAGVVLAQQVGKG